MFLMRFLLKDEFPSPMNSSWHKAHAHYNENEEEKKIGKFAQRVQSSSFVLCDWIYSLNVWLRQILNWNTIREFESGKISNQHTVSYATIDLTDDEKPTIICVPLQNDWYKAKYLGFNKTFNVRRQIEWFFIHSIHFNFVTVPDVDFWIP